MLREYLERFVAALASIKNDHARCSDRLRAYAGLFIDGFEQGLLPLCGALSAERSALPDVMGPQISDFFQLHLDWLSEVLEEGRAAGEVCETMTTQRAAVLLLSTLEGACLVGWALQSSQPVTEAFEALLPSVCAEQPRKRRRQPIT